MPQTNGANRLPSVTEVLRAVGLLRDFKGVPAHVLEHARVRGQAVHRAIHYYYEGKLDEATLHPEVEPGFRGYLRFVAESGYQPIASEIEFIHPTWNFIGHLDQVGWFKEDRSILDFKYTDAPDLVGATYQLAGYGMLWSACRPSEPIGRKYVLQLSPTTGNHRLHSVNDPHAEQVFLAALIVFRAKEGRNSHGR